MFLGLYKLKGNPKKKKLKNTCKPRKVGPICTIFLEKGTSYPTNKTKALKQAHKTKRRPR